MLNSWTQPAIVARHDAQRVMLDNSKDSRAFWTSSSEPEQSAKTSSANNSPTESAQYTGDSINSVKILNKTTNYFIVNDQVSSVSIEDIEIKCRLEISRDTFRQILESDEQGRFILLRSNPNSPHSFASVLAGQSLENKEDGLSVKVSDRFHALYDETIKHVDRWRSMIIKYITSSSTSFKNCDLSVLGQHFPRPEEIAVNVKLIELLEWDPENRFEIIRSNSKVYVKIRNNQAKEESSIQSWRDDVSQYLLSLPGYKARVNDISQAVPRPQEVSKSYKLSQILLDDPARFRMTGNVGSDIEIERIVNLAEAEELVETWKEDIIKCLKESVKIPLELGTLGAIVSRPEGLPKDMKLSIILQHDRKQRFVIKDVNGIPCAALRESTKRSTVPVAKMDTQKNYRGVVAGYDGIPKIGSALCQESNEWTEVHRRQLMSGKLSEKAPPSPISTTTIRSTDILSHNPLDSVVSTNTVVPPHQLPVIEKWKAGIARYLSTENKPMDLTFVGAAVLRPKGIPNTLKLKDVLAEDGRFVVHCIPPNKVFVSLSRSSLTKNIKMIHENISSQRSYSSFTHSEHSMSPTRTFDTSPTVYPTPGPQMSHSLLPVPAISDPSLRPPSFLDVLRTSNTFESSISNLERSDQQYEDSSALIGSSPWDNMVSSLIDDYGPPPGLMSASSPAPQTADSWNSNAFSMNMTPSPNKNSVRRFQPIEPFLSEVFFDQDPLQVRHFATNFRNAGFSVVEDLQYIQQRGELTLQLVENVANMKLGHYNRLVRYLAEACYA